MTAPDPADHEHSEIQTRLTQILRRPAGPETAQAMRELRDIPLFRDTPEDGARILRVQGSDVSTLATMPDHATQLARITPRVSAD